MNEIFQLFNYHNLGRLKEKEVLDYLYEENLNQSEISIYESIYWKYFFNINNIQSSRIYGKFMLFSYEPQLLDKQLEEIIKNNLSPLIKYSTDYNSKRGKSKITCIYTDRNVSKIKELANFIQNNEMIKKDIPFQAPYIFYDPKTNFTIKKSMMLTNFL